MLQTGRLKGIILSLLLPIILILFSMQAVGLSQTHQVKAAGPVNTPNAGIYLDNKRIIIGDTLKNVVKLLGEPQRKDTSEYGFEWYIYNKNYLKYIKIGIKNEKVTAIYSNASGLFTNDRKIYMGIKKSLVEKKLGKPVGVIAMGDSKRAAPNDTGISTYLVSDSYVTFFFDTLMKSSLSSIYIIDKNAGESELDSNPSGTPTLKESFEKELFDLSNASRVKKGKKPFVWDETAKSCAEKHSWDMAVNDFLSHFNLSNKSPFGRMKDEGIKYSYAAENIAAGQENAIFAHESLMNSKTHRDNILGKSLRLGVGVFFGGRYKTYFTQNFYTP